MKTKINSGRAKSQSLYGDIEEIHVQMGRVAAMAIAEGRPRVSMSDALGEGQLLPTSHLSLPGSPHFLLVLHFPQHLPKGNPIFHPYQTS